MPMSIVSAYPMQVTLMPPPVVMIDIGYIAVAWAPAKESGNGLPRTLETITLA